MNNSALPSEVYAPNLLSFEQLEELVSALSEEDLRDRVVDLLEAMEDLGIADVPSGRRNAYGDVIAGTDTHVRAALLQKDPRNSSCALVVRALWRFLGAEDEKLLDRFVIAKPFEYVCAFARQCDAWTDVHPGDDFTPRKGDVLVLVKGPRQHIFTLVDVDGDTFTSIDGGEPSEDAGVDDGTCNGIHRRVRQLDRETLCFAGDDRPVVGWIDVAKLQFSAPRIGLDRRS